MTEVLYRDGSGSTITLSNIDGRILTTSNSREQWEAATEMTARADDVFICAFPKSGLHWLWEMVSMLRARDATPIKEQMEYHILDFAPAEMLLKEDPRKSLRTFATHKYPNELPKMALQLNCKIVFILRDPKDVSVSYFNHLREEKTMKYEGDFPGFVPLFLDGKIPFNSYEEYMKRWSSFREQNKEASMHVVYYEDIKKNHAENVRGLAKFLEVETSDDLVDQIVSNTSFKTMKQNKEKLENVLLQFFKSGKEIMYRKGEVGDWRNWMSEAQGREFDSVIRSKLKDVNYKVLGNLNRYFEDSTETKEH